jgi:hypothetical protein
MNKPVLIAGAGPVGLTLAMALKRLGIAVRVVDKATSRTDKSQALVIWPRTLELLDIQGCAQAFLDAGTPFGPAARLTGDFSVWLGTRAPALAQHGESGARARLTFRPSAVATSIWQGVHRCPSLVSCAIGSTRTLMVRGLCDRSIFRLAGPFTRPCVRPAPASQPREADSPYGQRPLRPPAAIRRSCVRDQCHGVPRVPHTVRQFE